MQEFNLVQKRELAPLQQFINILTEDGFTTQTKYSPDLSISQSKHTH